MSKSMRNHTMLLMIILLAVNSVPPGRAVTLLRIDCGTDRSYTDSDKSLWQADGNFIRAGINAQIPDHNDYYGQFNDLRVFKEQNKNCYTLPTPTPGRYFIRAAFHYGNYDGNAHPPTFDLEIDRNRWTTVVTSRVWPPVYYELIYPTQGNNVDVCLARTQDNQFPFISTLEIWRLLDGMYEHMPADIAWHKSYRYNYGRDDDPDNWIVGYPTDTYNRIWEGYTLPGVTQHIAEVSLVEPIINYVPHDAITYAVEADDDTINLSFTFNKPDNFNYVEIYFTEIYPLSDNETRLIDLYVNGEDSITIQPVYNDTTSIYASLTTDETLSVQLRQNTSSGYPPVVSSIEVYTAGDPLVNITTSQDDYGLEALIHGFAKLNNWSGDPCLPNTTVWQWLDCTGNNPPRVNKIDLSGYGLDGPLPDFHQMLELETIDLSSNSLDGPIPSFLGALPNLKLLNLYGNNFGGKIPNSITNNKNLHYNVTGNPNLHHPKKKNLALIIGLSVGLPVGLILILIIVAYLLLLGRRRKPLAQGQPSSAGSGKLKPQIVSNAANTSTQTQIGTLGNIQQAQLAPSATTNLMSGSNQIPIINPTTNGAVNSGNMSVLQGINQEEVDELLDLHNRTR